MTVYMLSVFMGEDGPEMTEDEMQQTFKDVDVFNQEIMAAGKWVFGGGLEMPDTATVVKVTGDDVTTTDGPFAEAKEQVGGFWVLKAENLDEALELARQASKACRGSVEVRPFQPDTEG